MPMSWRRAIQNLIIWIVRPYVIRELPGWGKLTSFFDYRQDWLWADASTKTIREKIHGDLIRLDLSTWADRSYYFMGRWYDLEMQLLLADVVKSGDTIVDVGANRGNFALAASHAVGSAGKVICFEPNPKCIQVIEAEVALNEIDNISLHNCGLADKDDTLSLTVPLINTGEGSFAPSRYSDNVTFSAPVRRGDDILAGETPSVIKIDVEGFETKVLLGLTRTIKDCSPIVITEVVASHLERAGSSVAHLKNTMEGLGYKGFQLDLRKSDHRYDWCVCRFDASKDCDVVWFNEDIANQRFILKQRYR